MSRTWQLPLEPIVLGVYGDTGFGKSRQAGNLAEWLLLQTGAKLKDGKLVGGCKIRFYQWDSTDLPQALVDFRDWGALEVIDMRDFKLAPWAALCAAKGLVPERNAKGQVTEKWIESPLTPEVGLFIYDSGTQMMDNIMRFIAQGKITGRAMGGEDTFIVDGGEKALGIDDMMGTNNRTHYNIAQQRLDIITTEWGRIAHKHGALVYTTWMMDRGDDKEMLSRKVLGPKSAGSAWTPILPRKLGYTYRMGFDPRKPEGQEYTLYMRTHSVPESGNAEAICNARLDYPHTDFSNPADVKVYQELVAKVPKSITPADVVAAIKLNQQVCRQVRELRLKRFGG